MTYAGDTPIQPPRDPRIDPAAGDYLIVSERRHVRVVGVAPSLSGEALVQVIVFCPASQYHYIDTWRLGWYQREVRDAAVDKGDA